MIREEYVICCTHITHVRCAWVCVCCVVLCTCYTIMRDTIMRVLYYYARCTIMRMLYSHSCSCEIITAVGWHACCLLHANMRVLMGWGCNFSLAKIILDAHEFGPCRCHHCTWSYTASRTIRGSGNRDAARAGSG